MPLVSDQASSGLFMIITPGSLRAGCLFLGLSHDPKNEHGIDAIGIHWDVRRKQKQHDSVFGGDSFAEKNEGRIIPRIAA